MLFIGCASSSSTCGAGQSVLGELRAHVELQGESGLVLPLGREPQSVKVVGRERARDLDVAPVGREADAGDSTDRDATESHRRAVLWEAGYRRSRSKAS